MEYVFLIGVAAAALIVMLVYVGRGLQGNLRNQSSQMGVLQYEPGNVVINNMETKQGTMTSSVGSSTTVQYGNMNEPETNDSTISDIIAKIEAKSAIISDSEESIPSEMLDGAITQVSIAASDDSFSGADFIWQLPENSGDTMKARQDALEALEGKEGEIGLKEQLDNARDAWLANRTPNETSSSSYSSEEGESDMTKTVSEELGAF